MKKFVLILFLIFCAVEVSATSYYALEIIQPRPSLNTNNRFYKAYPGIAYNVRPGVIGGAYPFTYSLTVYPSGMTINSSTGEINWPNPVEVGSPHSVTLKVVDSDVTEVTVSWTITVNTSNAIFVDSVNGHNTPAGTGILANPFKDLTDVLSTAKHTTTFPYYFVYFRAGTYDVTGLFYETWDDPALLVPINYDHKPLVWIGYPGETATLDLSYAGLYFYVGCNDLWIDNLSVIVNQTTRGGYTRGFEYESDCTRVCFRRLNFSDMYEGTAGGNPSLIFQGKGGGVGKYHVIQDCTYSDAITMVYFLLQYLTDRTLVEDNTIGNMTTGCHVIGPKDMVTMAFYRHNTIIDSIEGIGGLLFGQDPNNVNSGDIEVSFNLFKYGNNNEVVLDADGYSGTIGKLYFVRNTIIGMVDINDVTTSKGPYYFYNNVIINTHTSDADHLYVHNSSAPTRVVRADNLSGVTADAIVDSNGNLQGTYRTTYLGTRGYELSGGSTYNESVGLSSKGTYSQHLRGARIGVSVQ
jgi:hypothetical protein